MPRTTITDERLKAVVKEALLELFEERRDLFYELLADVVEDIAMAHSIKPGDDPESGAKRRVFHLQRGEA